MFRKTGNAVKFHVFVDTLYYKSERPLSVVIGKTKTICDLRKAFSEQKYYRPEEQHWVINGMYCFDEFQIKSITEQMTPFKKGFVAFLLMMSVEEKNDQLEYFATFSERRYLNVNLDDRWHEPFPVLMIVAEVFDSSKPEPVVGWNCTHCTFFNKPYQECCETCGCSRPDDFKMPDTYYYTKDDKQRMDKGDEMEERQKRMEEELKKKMEQDKIDNLELLKNIAKDKLVYSTCDVECPICGGEYGPGEAIVLRNCLHTICKECLKEYLTTISDPEVKCFDMNCVGHVEDQEIQGILDDEQYERYQQLSLRTAEGKTQNTFHCKTPNCVAWVVFDDNVNEFPCPLCNKTNCITCGAIHENQTCKEYQDELAIKARNDEAAKKDFEFLQNLITTGAAMNCPGCRIIIQRKDGCEWIQCNMCKIEICWATKGPRWGPGGTGDISGGCRCGVDGRSCHPTCRSCH